MTFESVSREFTNIERGLRHDLRRFKAVKRKCALIFPTWRIEGFHVPIKKKG